MAREAGLRVGTNLSGVVLVGSPAEIGLAHLTIEELERFAALVAAAERERICKARVDLTYHADGNVGIGTPPDASAPMGMGEPIERLRVSLTDGAQEERNKLAAWMMSQGYATGHGDSIEKLLEELEWQIEERIKNEREACAKVCEDAISSIQIGKNVCINLANIIRARGEK